MSSSFESFDSLETRFSPVWSSKSVWGGYEIVQLLLGQFFCNPKSYYVIFNFFSLCSREDQSLFEYLAQNHDVSNRTRSSNPMSCPGMSLL